MKWRQELSPGAGQHLEERKMNQPRVWEVAAWKVESKAQCTGGPSVLEAKWRTRKQWATVLSPAHRTSEVRTENWLLDLATWRSLVVLKSISQWGGGVESLSVMDSRQNERRGGYDGEHAVILWGILLCREQRAEQMPGLGHGVKGERLFYMADIVAYFQAHGSDWHEGENCVKYSRDFSNYILMVLLLSVTAQAGCTCD